jgi:hypothetical protein
MKSLLEYLLTEKKSKEEKPKKEKAAAGEYKEIKNAGGITNLAKEVIGAGSFSKALVKAASKDGQEDIKNQLKVQTTDRTILGTIKKIVKADNNLAKLFDNSKIESMNGGDGIQIKIVEKVSDLAGTQSSSERLIKFWMQSTLRAYGAPWNDSDVIYFISRQGIPRIVITKR